MAEPESCRRGHSLTDNGKVYSGRLRCTECIRVAQRSRYLRLHPESLSRARRGEGQRSTGAQLQRQRGWVLKTSYGLSAEAYDAMFVAQNERCAICGTEVFGTRNGRVTYPHVDHDHDTGKVRGLLCHKCNSGLGFFDDCPEIMLEAVAYLTKVGL